METFLIWWMRGVGAAVLMASGLMYGLSFDYGRPAGSAFFCAFMALAGVAFIAASIILPRTQKDPGPQ